MRLPRIQLTRDSRKKALILAFIVGIASFILGTVGSRFASLKVTNIIVAANDLPAGQVLGEKDLKVGGKVSGQIPPGVLTSIKQAEGLSLAYPVKSGQPIVDSLISKTPQRNGLYPGEVGAWVSVNLTSAGLVRQGDLVDVFVATGGDYGKSSPPQMINSLLGVRVAQVINSSAQIIGANQSTDGGSSNAGVPAAIELAIPKSQITDYSQIAAGKISLLMDPFATPLTGTPIGSPSINSLNGSGTSKIPQQGTNQGQGQSNTSPQQPGSPNNPIVNNSKEQATPSEFQPPQNSQSSSSTPAGSQEQYNPTFYTPNNP